MRTPPIKADWCIPAECDTWDIQTEDTTSWFVQICKRRRFLVTAIGYRKGQSHARVFCLYYRSSKNMKNDTCHKAAEDAMRRYLCAHVEANRKYINAREARHKTIKSNELLHV